jgi:hypothetical protein
MGERCRGFVSAWSLQVETVIRSNGWAPLIVEKRPCGDDPALSFCCLTDDALDAQCLSMRCLVQSLPWSNNHHQPPQKISQLVVIVFRYPPGSVFPGGGSLYACCCLEPVEQVL